MRSKGRVSRGMFDMCGENSSKLRSDNFTVAPDRQRYSVNNATDSAASAHQKRGDRRPMAHHRHKKLIDGQSSDKFTVVLDLHSCINNPNDAALTQHFMVLL